MIDDRYSSASVSKYYELLDKISEEIQDAKNRDPDGYRDTPMSKLKAALDDKDNAPPQRSRS